MATVTITNILTKVIADGKEAFAPISPTCVPVPCTPVQEYISDMVTLTDGTLLVPAFKKFQKLSIPFGAKTTFEVTEPDEINYWENIKLVGAKVAVENEKGQGIEPINKYTYTVVTFSGTGTQKDPYVPAFAAKTYYIAPLTDTSEAIASEPDNWGTANTFYTRAKTVLPTNDVKDE